MSLPATPRTERPPALSASSAKTYMQCPLKFRFQAVDRRVEPPTEATLKGTVVHEALDRLFDLPAQRRDVDAALELLPAAWEHVLDREPGAAIVFDDAHKLDQAQDDSRKLLDNYFKLEYPQNLAPRAREKFVDARLDSGILLRGIVDRIDEAPDGALRVVDYKTGKAPGPRFTEEALFQMRFYALLLQKVWRLPARLQLLYLRSIRSLTLDPDPRDIVAFEQDLLELWSRIDRDLAQNSFQTRTSALCNWCSFKPICPAFGGVAPPASEEGLERVRRIQDQNPGTN